MSTKVAARPFILLKNFDIIEDVMEQIRTKLALQYDKVLIASDHGASRLAVIHEREEKYKVGENSKGRHGGRCMEKPSGFSPTSYDLPFVTESGDGEYLVLANYGRFKGSRKQNIEVHGGASLEEVVIPIIEITRSDANNKVELLDKDSLYASFRKKLEFMLKIKTESTDISVSIKGKPNRYMAKKTSSNLYHVLTDITRPGKYEADVLDGDTIKDKIILNVQSETQRKSGKNDGFEDVF